MLFRSPAGKLGTALGTNPIEQAAAQRADTAVSDLSRRTQLAYTSVQSSYDQVTQLARKDPNAWFNLAQAAQQAGDNTTAVKGYRRYLKLSPGSSTAPQIKQLIKQLSPAPPKPSGRQRSETGRWRRLRMQEPAPSSAAACLDASRSSKLGWPVPRVTWQG